MRLRILRFRTATTFVAMLLLLAPRAIAAAPAAEQAIEGVQPAALDQPRIYLNFRRTLNAPPLATKSDAKTKKPDIFGDVDAGPQSGTEAFLDTGASGVVLSADSVKQLGISVQKARDGQNVKFSDTGIGGAESFDVAEPLLIALAAYPKSDPENPA